MKKESYGSVETFFSFYDASLWLEKNLEEFDKSEWYLEQASINYMNGLYRCGFYVSKKQGEFDV